MELLNTASLTIGASMTYAGHFLDSDNGDNQLNLGAFTLTLTGITDFEPSNGVDVVAGSGTLKLMHAATLGGTTLDVGGTANLDINNKVIATGALQIGDASPNAAHVVIAAGATYDLVADSGVGRGASAASTLTNNGLFEKTAGTGVSIVSTDFVNNGTITVTSGTLEFLAGTLSGSGSRQRDRAHRYERQHVHHRRRPRCDKGVSGEPVLGASSEPAGAGGGEFRRRPGKRHALESGRHNDP